jgi:leucine dehydrogenase
MIIREQPTEGFQRVVFARDDHAGYRAWIVVHSTRLGAAVGGTRLLAYPSEPDALTDALRLARGMTYKCALAGLPAGGGKSVILDPGPGVSREALFLAHGRAVSHLAGEYITAEDVGTTPGDMAVIRRETEHVAGLPDGTGDPSPHTARGVFRALQAARLVQSGSDDLRGVTVALQGYGAVGSHLASQLREAGAQVVVGEAHPGRRAQAAALGLPTVPAEEIYDVDAEVFAPCALGAVLSAESVPRLRARLVVGGANNQLATPEDGERLAQRGILYVPDFLANAGGVITGVGELTRRPPTWAMERVDALFDTARAILDEAKADGILPVAAAERAAERRLSEGPR